jgi:hypothetical protein
VNMCSQFRDLVFQVFDALAALVNLREVGVLKGVGSVRAACRSHLDHLEIDTIQIYSIIND